MIILKNFRHKTIVWGLPLLMILLSPMNAFAFNRSQNAAGTVCYYWPNRSISFSVNDACSKDVSQADCYAAVQESIAQWGTGHSCTDLQLIYAGTTSKTNTGADYFNLIIWRESDWKYDSTAIAMTTTTFNTNTGEIFDADVELNGVDYIFSTSTPCIEDPSDRTMDIRNTLTHELGHCIGLAHTSIACVPGNEAVMCPTAEPCEIIKRTLSADDIAGLCDIYPAGENTPLCSGQSEITASNSSLYGSGCATASNSEIPGLALIALLLFFSRTYFRRVNRR